MKQKKISFISSAIQQPRHQKRISKLRENNIVRLYYSIRPQYKKNLEGFDKKGVFLGVVENKKYHKRFFYMLKLTVYLIFDKNKNIYCTSREQALIAILLKKKVVLELGDINHPSRFVNTFYSIESFILKRISGLVVTSPYFLSGYFSKFDNYKNVDSFILENKLPFSVDVTVEEYRNNYINYSPESVKKIGLIGSIRFPKMLIEIKKLVSKRKDIELHIFGDGCLSIFESLDNCIIHGPFKNPDELAEIYSSIHVNIILYDVKSEGVKLALPNKLYESIGFLRPIICAKGCALSAEVEKLEIGLATELDCLEETVDAVFENYNKHVQNIKRLPKDKYLDNQSSLQSFVESAYK